MKIAFVTFLGFPSNVAASINVFRACHAMGKMGHEVILVAPRNHHEKLRRRSPFLHYGLDPTFSLKELPHWNGPGGRHFYTMLVTRLLRRFSPDLVIGRHLRTIMAATRAGFNTVYELHTTIKKKREKLEWLLRRPNFRLLVTVSRRLRCYYLGLGLEGLQRHRIISLPTCREPMDQPPPPQSLPKATQGMNIGYFGKLEQQKGIELLAAICREVRHHDFHIVGGDDPSVAHWSQRMGWPHCHFHGYLPPKEAEGLMAAMDLCLLPNQPPPGNPKATIFSSPMKALDYMALGRPILASDLPELHEILGEDEALFLPHHDAEAWIQAIETMEPARAAELGRRARERFLNHFTMTARCETMIRCAMDQGAAQALAREQDEECCGWVG